MEEKSLSDDKQLIDLLNELMQVQTQIAAIISTRFERQTTDNVQSKVIQKENSVIAEAQRYGRNPDLAKDAIEQYQNALEQIRSEYSAEKNLWLAQASESQEKENKLVLEIAKGRNKQSESYRKQEHPETKVRKTITKSDGIAISEGRHPLQNFNEVKNNLRNASLEEVSVLLDYYNGNPVLIEGNSYHPFNDPLMAARFNARYFELTGENHPRFVEQAPQVIDNLLKDAPKLMQEGAYTPMYFEKIARIKNNIINEQENENQEISDKKEQLQIARDSSSLSQENIKDCKERCDNTIDDISEDRDLVEKNDKQSIFSKLFSKIKDRIGGKEKFNKNVIEPLKNKAKHIKTEVLPNVKVKIQQEVMPKLKLLMERGKEKVNEMNLKEKFNNLMSKAKEGAKSIIEKSRGIKGTAILAFSKGLSLAKEGISKVAEKVSTIVENTAEK